LIKIFWNKAEEKAGCPSRIISMTRSLKLSGEIWRVLASSLLAKILAEPEAIFKSLLAGI